MARLFAVIAAVALMVVAFQYRTGGEGPADERGIGPQTLVCSIELAEACQQLSDTISGLTVRVEPAWTTFDRLLEPEGADVDLWLVAGPWPQMLNERLERNQQLPLFGDAVAVASAPLTAVIYNEDLGRLPCAAEPTWACLGTAAAAGDIRLGTPDPDRHASGILVLAAATGAQVGDPEFASNDLTVEHEARVTDLGRRFDEHSATDLETMLSAPALLDGYADVRPPANAIVSTAAARDRVTLAVPTPVATAVVFFAGVDEDGARSVSTLEGIVANALEEFDWSTDPPPASDEDGLPSPGVLEALRGLIR